MFTASAGKYRKVNKVLSLQNLDFGITYWNLRQPILIGKQRKQYITCTLCFHNSDLRWGGGGQNKPAGISSPPHPGGQDIPGQLAPKGESCPAGQDKLLHRYIVRKQKQKSDFLKLNVKK